MMLGILIFWGIAATSYRGGHITVDLVWANSSPRYQRWIDVFENQGKKSGAYSAPVYGANPYMLMNYNDTLDAVFTLAHELGHSMHTMLSHETQPFVYSGYTIFVAEVPSTLNEALLLNFMLERAKTKNERVVLLQHSIDNIVSTVYNQVLFADFELETHRLVEQERAQLVLHRERITEPHVDELARRPRNIFARR